MDLPLVNHGKRADFSIISQKQDHLLLALKAKRLSKPTSIDFIRLAKELKELLSKINSSGYKIIGVAGLPQEGLQLEAYTMDSTFDKLHRMVSQRQASLPTNCYGFNCLGSVVGTMKSAREVTCSAVITTHRRIESVERAENAGLPKNMMGSHSADHGRSSQRVAS